MRSLGRCLVEIRRMKRKRPKCILIMPTCSFDTKRDYSDWYQGMWDIVHSLHVKKMRTLGLCTAVFSHFRAKCGAGWKFSCALGLKERFQALMCAVNWCVMCLSLFLKKKNVLKYGINIFKMHLSTIKINSNRKQLLESQEVKNFLNKMNPKLLKRR